VLDVVTALGRDHQPAAGTRWASSR
jgi:hypothetical protein